MDGWIIDAQLGDDGITMDIWMFVEPSGVQRVIVPWAAAIHVHATKQRLEHLMNWLECAEIAQRFAVGSMQYIRRRLSLDQYEMHDVLEIEMADNRLIRSLAEHIESRGDYHRYTLYSVDAHLAQRFFVEHQVAPFQYVRWDGVGFSSLEENGIWPELKQMEMEFHYEDSNGFDTLDSRLEEVVLNTATVGGSSDKIHSIRIKNNASDGAFVQALQHAIETINPDLVLTQGGDSLHLSVLQRLSDAVEVPLTMSRKPSRLEARTASRTVHSYGQVKRKNSYFPMHGRMHIDLRSSFIVREGGLLGLFELARHSRQSPQDISRLSPGSVISAIQIRTAMEDGVLVPWKKNRPEDTKTAWELMMADRGGLYLDSQPGLYTDVVELDFASLFPNIIATRNISPETLNCACCQPSKVDLKADHLLPLNVESARKEFRRRHLNENIGTGLFPVTHSWALPVPGLSSHTCGRIHGFLGRVVAPIIERRVQLKELVVTKGDIIDKQQNALKWLLVTCFGYTGYKNARFGRIEAHEAICAWSREILLKTIAMAEDEGWTVLHAIVDCVWIENRTISDREEKRRLALQFAQRVTREIGIPLEYEDMYHFIGFLPSRMHGAGSLTKYWAYGDKGLKMRGIESRQHSTCQWVKSLQDMAFEILIDCVRDGINVQSRTVQNSISGMLHKELGRLERNGIDMEDLVVKRRVSKTIDQFTVSTLTHAALLRAAQLGHEIPPGGKVKFVVLKTRDEDPTGRVILMEELPRTARSEVNIDHQHYRELARRAIWAILAPFGWTDEEIRVGLKAATLFDYTSTDNPFNSTM